MKKLYSLIKACMTSDMNLFKINSKRKGNLSKLILPLFVSLCFMFSIWSNANLLLEKTAPMELQSIVLSIFVFLTALLTIIEGVYKSGALIFNCKDDQLLLSLPIKRRTVLFVRIFKFYVFELIFNSLFILPLILAYIRWVDNLNWTFFLTSFVMLIMLPIIPIVISCIVGAVSQTISSRFKYKNTVQIIISMFILLVILFVSFNFNNLFDYLIKNANHIKSLISKIYYPAFAYANLATNFNFLDLIVFILINVVVVFLSLFILSKFYFKINSRSKNITTTKHTKLASLTIKSKSKTYSLIKKELNTFFSTPVFIINAGFGLVLFILATILVTIKFNSVLSGITSAQGINFSEDLIMNNISLLIFALISVTAYMTSITNSVISLEGKNINILKSLPIKTKTILMSKIYSSLLITTPALLIGDIILFIRFKTNAIELIVYLS